ncbi:MAG: DUF4115 domain-containing protein [Candidatus Omnitrophica bacterium]|nr:DUF4115 domain-containing protein [Candidatus Omnitrophota bacterium]
MQEICRKLRQKRKELGYSIEHVVEKTKLHPSVIKDIEDCNFENISSTYLKGFIKIYASFLEVDTNQSVEDPELVKPDVKKIFQQKTLPQKENIQKDVHQKTSAPQKRKPRPDLAKIIVERLKKISPEVRKKIAKVLIALLVAWLVFSLGRLVITKVKSFFANKPKAEKTKETVNDERSMVDIEQGQEITASITAKKKCFLRVTVDGKLLFEGVLNNGAVESWKGVKEIEFKISDGSAVYLEVNGKSIPTLSSIRKPIKSLKITPSGISIDK